MDAYVIYMASGVQVPGHFQDFNVWVCIVYIIWSLVALVWYHNSCVTSPEIHLGIISPHRSFHFDLGADHIRCRQLREVVQGLSDQDPPGAPVLPCRTRPLAIRATTRETHQLSVEPFGMGLQVSIHINSMDKTKNKIVIVSADPVVCPDCNSAGTHILFSILFGNYFSFC